MFADDLISHSVDAIQLAVNQVMRWAKNVHMIVNEKKTTALLFANNHCISKREQGDKQLSLEGHTIDFTETIMNAAPTKLLGVVLDRYARFGNHALWLMPQVQLRTYTAASLIRKEGGVSPHTMSVVVKALIRSRILYAAEVWYPYLGQIAQQLQIEYNRALRLIHGLPRFTPVDSMLLEVGQLPLEAQVSINMVKAYERWSRGYPDLHS